MSSKQNPQTMRAATLPETSAADLAVMIENGEGAEALNAHIQSLSRPNYIHVLRVVRQLDSALSNYALSWQGAEYWGSGAPFPDEADEDEQEAEAVERMAA